VAAIRRASVKEIAEVPGIGTRIAEVILGYLEKERTPAFDAKTGEILEGS
jgi:Holliday junction resolvasome RuvABC DNA-binding subunit